MHLPRPPCISERSRKFYDGTFSISKNGLGFTDDSGVYRDFDCSDEAARAPTPLPPMFPDDIIDECQSKDAEFPYADYRITTADSPSFSPSSSVKESRANISRVKRLSDSLTKLTFASDSADGDVVTVSKDDLFHGHKDRERLISKAQKMLTASRRADTELSLAECYKSCGVSYDAKVFTGNARWPISAEKPRTELSKLSSSPLSDYPSDLSEQELDNKTIKKPKTETKRVVNDPIVAESPCKSQIGRRGVAQKVIKTPKKASRAPAMVSLQQNGGVATKRRPVRRSNAYGNRFIK